MRSSGRTPTCSQQRSSEFAPASPSHRHRGSRTRGRSWRSFRRNGGHGLKSFQNLAGMRIVVRADRRHQDAVVQQLVDVFGEDPRPPKVVDRRAAPVNGYRAVHVIAFPDGIPVEIQMRTRWQHEWAELFEKLADRVGRGIRYGEPPARMWSAAEYEAMGPAETSEILLSGRSNVTGTMETRRTSSLSTIATLARSSASSAMRSARRRCAPGSQPKTSSPDALRSRSSRS
jgi:Region found in RelA / SpoT proteins